MKGYSARCAFTPAEVELHARATELVAELPDQVDVDDVRCHELARAVGSILGLQVVDGHYCLAEHSWLLTGHGPGNLLDVYAVASLPPVQLVYAWGPRLQRGHVSRYVERKGGISGLVVDEAKVADLRATMLWRERLRTTTAPLGNPDPDHLGDEVTESVRLRWDKRTTALRALRALGRRLAAEVEKIYEVNRACGSSLCVACGLPLADHPSHPVESMAWATVLCDGSLVKL